MSWLALSLELDVGPGRGGRRCPARAGALSVEITDAHAGTPQERPIFGEPGSEPEQRLADKLCDCAVRRGTSMRRRRRAAALASLGIANVPPLRVSQSRSRTGCAPVSSSSPRFRSPRACGSCRAGAKRRIRRAINLRLDPGLAFGTGSHPTTWQCLRWLEANLRPARRCWTMVAAAVCWESLRKSSGPARW